MNSVQHVPLDAGHLLRRVAEKLPSNVVEHVVVIGSIATAWAFRDVTKTQVVATKDIDVLLHPGVDAVLAGQELGRQLLREGWTPQYPNGMKPGSSATPDNELPVLRLSPPGEADEWFMELLAEPTSEQMERKRWQRMTTDSGHFGLPSFRYMGVAIYEAEQTEFGVRVAQPAYMALAHLLEHADPDLTPISGLRNRPPRYLKDVGRAVALWWLTNEQAALRGERTWPSLWRSVLSTRFPGREGDMLWLAQRGINSLRVDLNAALPIANESVLAAYRVTRSQWEEAWSSFHRFIAQLVRSES